MTMEKETVHQQVSPDGSKNGPVLEVKDLWAGYQKRSALEGVSFSVKSGSVVGVVGPNGAGKSTLFKVILGLHKRWRGEIRVLGIDGKDGRASLGYMPQVEQVDWQFPISAYDVVLMGCYGRLGLFRRVRRKDKEAAWRCLEQVGLADLARRQIGELSGGQQRRILIARALAQEPTLLLLDEPMAGLDATAQHELLALLEELRKEGKTILVATHDLSCVATSFNHALCLNKRVFAYGPPKAILTKEVLNATFKSHLLLLDREGDVYAVHK